jgi:hypothetical protein
VRLFIFISLFFPPLIFAHFFPFTDFLEQMVAATFLSVGLVVGLFGVNRIISVPRFFVFWVLLGVLWFFVGISNDLPRSSSWLWHFIVWVFGLAAIVVAGLMTDKFGRNQFSILLAWALMLSSIFQALIGLIQYYGLLELVFPWANYGGSRFSGTLGQANLTAFSLSLGSLSALFLLYVRQISKIWFCALLGGLIFAIILTGSRTSVIYVAVIFLMSGVLLFSRRGSCRPQIIFGVGALILIVILGFLFTPTVNNKISEYASIWVPEKQYGGETGIERFSDFSSYERLCEWEKALQFIASGQVDALGEGLGSYSSFSFQRDIIEITSCGVNKMWDNPHNILITSVIEWGWLGLLVIVLVLSYIAHTFLRQEKDCTWFFSGSAVLMFFFYSLLEYPLWNLYFLMLFLFFISILDSRIFVKCSSKFMPRFSSIVYILAFLAVFYNSVFSYVNITEIFNKREAGAESKLTLYSLGSNSLYGGDAVLVRYYRFLPEPSQISQQISEAKNIFSWQPNPLALTRLVVLGALSPSVDACPYFYQLHKKYPRFVNFLESDIALLRENVFIVEQNINECVFEGENG